MVPVSALAGPDPWDCVATADLVLPRMAEAEVGIASSAATIVTATTNARKGTFIRTSIERMDAVMTTVSWRARTSNSDHSEAGVG